MAVRRGGGREVSGQWHSSAGRELRWLVALEARPYSVGVEEGRCGRSQMGRMVVDGRVSPRSGGDGGARTGTGEEEGSPVAGVGKADA
jgi:hypothetical protein